MAKALRLWRSEGLVGWRLEGVACRLRLILPIVALGLWLLIHLALLHRIEYRWIILNNTGKIAHKIFQIWLIAHVPSRKIGNCYLILGSKITFRSYHALRKLLVHICLRRSEGVATHKNNFHCK